MIDAITSYLGGVYREDEYPALSSQIAAWQLSRPLAGIRVLDATPVFRNTLVKYRALLAGGAELTVGISDGIPRDDAIVAALRRWGVPVATPDERHEFDVVCDCAGRWRHAASRCGYVELTRSGCQYYRNLPQPVFVADSGRIKLIETILGTGDGFFRGLAALGYGGVRGRKTVIFGGGKVGYGVASRLMAEGACVAVVDRPEVAFRFAELEFADLNDRPAVRRLVAGAWCVVTATGVAGAVAEYAGDFMQSAALLANIGVEDEFGPGVPASRVLNGKKPVNFILEEPTHLKYIDPTMALDDLGVLEVLAGRCRPGLNAPEPELEERVLAQVRKCGAIKTELINEEAKGIWRKFC